MLYLITALVIASILLVMCFNLEGENWWIAGVLLAIIGVFFLVIVGVISVIIKL